MKSKTHDYPDKIIEVSLLSLVFLGPLAIAPFNAEPHALPKLLVLIVVVFTVYLAWIWKMYRSGGWELRRTPLDLPIIAFLLTAMLSTMFSRYPFWSVFGTPRRYAGFYTWFVYGLLYFAVVNNMSEARRVCKFLSAALISGALVSIYAIFQHYGWDFIRLGQLSSNLSGQSLSFLGNTNFTADYLVLIFPLAAVYSVVVPGIRRLLPLLVTITVVVALIFTNSRGGWLGFIVSAVLLFASVLKRMGAKQKRQLVFIIVITVALAVLLGVFYEPWTETAASVGARFLSIFNFQQSSVKARLSLWRSTVGAIVTRPVLGWGLETFRLIYPQFRDPALMGAAQPIVDKPHNEFLEIGVSMGLLGLLIYLWIIGTFLARVGKEYYRAGHSSFSLYVTSLFAALSGYFVALVFSFGAMGVGFLSWLYMGFGMVITDELAGQKPQYLRLRWNKWMIGAVAAAGIALGVFLSVVVRDSLADWYGKRGYIAIENGNVEEAMVYLERAVRVSVHSEEYRAALTEVYLIKGTETREERWFGEAIDQMALLVESNPLSVDFRFALGDVNMRAYSALRNGQLLASAGRAYAEVADLDPLNSVVYQRLGLVYEIKGDKKQARRNYQRALRLNPANETAKHAFLRLKRSE